MTELLQHATDDQIALVFCGAALFVSASVMYFSYYVGQMARRQAAPARAESHSPAALHVDADDRQQDLAA